MRWETTKGTVGKGRYARVVLFVLFLHLQGDQQLRATGLVSISVFGHRTQRSALHGKRQATARGNSEAGWLIFVCTGIHLLPTISKCPLVTLPLAQASPALGPTCCLPPTGLSLHDHDHALQVSCVTLVSHLPSLNLLALACHQVQIK